MYACVHHGSQKLQILSHWREGTMITKELEATDHIKTVRRVLFKGNSVLYFVEVFNYSSEAWLSKFVWFSMPAYILNFEAIISCLRVYNICMHD